MTKSRSAVWPTYAAKFSPSPWLCTESRYSGKVEKSHGTPASSVATSMSSTFSSVRAMRLWCSGRVGAMEKPQLPATMVVTP